MRLYRISTKTENIYIEAANVTISAGIAVFSNGNEFVGDYETVAAVPLESGTTVVLLSAEKPKP